MKTVRQVVAYKRYFLDFYKAQSEDVQAKIEWTLKLLQTVDRVPKKYFEHVTGTKGLFEIRIEYEGNIYRIFSFFDSDKLIILCNSYQKKTQKAPKSEIEKALKIKKEYEDEKE